LPSLVLCTNGLSPDRSGHSHCGSGLAAVAPCKLMLQWTNPGCKMDYPQVVC